MPFSPIRNAIWVMACAVVCAAPALAARPHTVKAHAASAHAASAASAHAAAVRTAAAAPAGMPYNASEPLNISAGKGTLVRLSENASSVFVADPTVADVHVPSPLAVFVLGKKTGTTTLYVLGANNKTLVQRTIVVGRDMDGLRSMIAARFPSMNVQMSTGQGSLQLSGNAANSADADAVVQAVTPYLADKEVLINRMTIDRPLQVQLRVRITEVDRNVTQQLAGDGQCGRQFLWRHL
jgi:pilus assembly protein CpaC